MIEAKIICDSVNPCGNRITSWILKFPRFILAEFNTHRALSRNSSSSRAIPIEKLMQTISEQPATPEFWGKNQKGMQAIEEIDADDIEAAKGHWYEAMVTTLDVVRSLNRLNVHKQIVNRLLEPWMHQTVLCTATEWENFFALRAEKSAQPEFQKLAFLMLDLYNSNVPKKLNVNEWHIPFGDKYLENITTEEALKICTARAARVSYNNFDGDIDFSKDFVLHDNLLQSGHMSPFEHCAQAMPASIPSGNFIGWRQYRKTILDENRKDPRVKNVLPV